MPRAMPVSASSSRSAISGAKSAAIRRSIQWPSRRRTFSATLGSASSSTKGWTCGLERVGAGDELADGVLAPHQAALLGDVDLGVGGVVELVGAQADSAGASAARPAARSVRAWSASAEGSRRKRKPSSRPMNWSSIETSPFSVTVATRLSLCFNRRISTEVRRSTNRWVSCTCSASDSRSSTARVSSRQWSASSTQACRCAT